MLNLVETFSEFKDGKNIDRPTMVRVLEDVFRTLIKKKFGSDENFDVIVNTQKGDLELWRVREIVPDGEVADEISQISISEAISIDADYEVGEECYEQLQLEDFGRRSIMAARQTLISRIMDLEKEEVFKKYNDRLGEIVTAEVHQILKKEILIVDEVLAVGDAEFQKKCLGKMGDVSKGEGRTVLFVSHNMGSIQQLCNKGIVLENGISQGLNSIHQAIEKYLSSNNSNSIDRRWMDNKLTTDKNVALQEVSIVDSKNESANFFSNSTSLKLTFKYCVTNFHEKKYRMVISFYTGDMINIFNTAFFLNNERHRLCRQ